LNDDVGCVKVSGLSSGCCCGSFFCLECANNEETW